MKIFTLHEKQIIPIGLDEAWEFFSNPYNLSKITPPEMDFKIKNKVDPKIYNGMIIEYTVKPMLNIECSWLTEIKHVEDHRIFVDEQRVGPYKIWYHQHIFRSVEGGVEVEDIVHYVLPLCFLSGIVNHLFIKNKLKSIFDYRKKVIEDNFGKV